MSELPIVPSPGQASSDPWEALRAATAARVALGRAGAALPTTALLAFELDQAKARDAVHRTLDADAFASSLAAATGLPTLRVHSDAPDRATYLLRPDLGRRLCHASRTTLEAACTTPPCDVVVVVADGLSAPGVEAHAPDLLVALLPKLQGLALGPLVIAEQARVALGDSIGEALRARLVVVVIGERPGLTSPDSMGLYLTYEPRVGRNDAERNCISNVRTAGLAPALAASRLAWLIRSSLRRALSGVALKDESSLIELDDAAGDIVKPASG